MGSATTYELLLRLRQTGLLTAEQLAQVEYGAARSDSTPSALAAELTQRGWLTEWQLSQLLSASQQRLLLGPYVLLEPIATGGMGQIYLARHQRMRRVVALKLLKRSGLDALGVQRFVREAQAAALLSHPNIIAVHDAGQDGEQHYLAMEYVKGIDLGRLVQQVGPLPVAVACDYARQIALGLQHAHEHGFVHRDIKPSNALVAPRPDSSAEDGYSRFAGGQVKILDMGLVRPMRDMAVPVPLTEQGSLLGTIDYLAPEQAQDATRVDGRADLYSLGCTLFYLLTGRPVFPGGLPLDKIVRHRDEMPPAIQKLRDNLPPALSQLLPRLLAKQPEQRPASAAEVAEALAPLAEEARYARLVAFAAPGPISSGDLTDPGQELPPTRVMESSTQQPPRRGWAGLLGALVLLVLASIGVVAWVVLHKPAPGIDPSLDLDGQLLSHYWPEDLIGVVECDLQRLEELEPVLPGLGERCRTALIQAVGMPQTATVRCLQTEQGWLALSPLGQAAQPPPRGRSQAPLAVEVAGQPVYVLEVPPYRLTSTRAGLVQQARDAAKRQTPRAAEPTRDVVWPHWVIHPPAGQVPLWFCLQLELGPEPHWPQDELRQELSEQLAQAYRDIRLLSGWLHVTDNKIEMFLEVWPRRPERLRALGETLEQIQTLAIDYNDADLPRDRAWSPLGRLLRFARWEQRGERWVLHRTIQRD